jgi:hypothetical protein
MTKTLCAAGVGICVTVAAYGQTPHPAVLSGALRDHVRDERFDVVTSIRGLPLGVRDELQELFGSRTLDIAEPGAEFQDPASRVEGDARGRANASAPRDRPAGARVGESEGRSPSGEKTLPLRRLVAAGCSMDYCLVYYERGGSAHTWLVALFHWTPAATRLEWGGQARGGLASIDEVRDAVLSGEVRGPVREW